MVEPIVFACGNNLLLTNTSYGKSFVPYLWQNSSTAISLPPRVLNILAKQ